jgi:hypothetical protein
MTFQAGNELAKRKGVWKTALRKAMASDNGQRVLKAAQTLLDEAAKGESWAIKELADRLDGRPGQDLNIGGQEDNPLVLEPAESLTAKIRAIVATRELIERVGGD